MGNGAVDCSVAAWAGVGFDFFLQLTEIKNSVIIKAG